MIVSASALGLTEDAILRQRMERALENPAVGAGRDARVAYASAPQRYVGAESLPSMFSILGTLEDGHHEVDVGGRDFMVLVDRRAEGSSVFVVYDVSSIEVSNLSLGRVFLGIAAGLAVIIALSGIGIGRVLSKRLIAPFEGLAQRVDATPFDKLDEALSSEGYDQEIAFLVDELRARIRQLRTFAEREAQFTRFVNHELRNPVAVVKNAAELLRHVGAASSAPLDRIERAVADMESLIDCFLWLARAAHEADRHEEVELGLVVEDLIARYEYLSTAKNINVRVEGDGRVVAPATVLEVAISNLVANAVQFTPNGSVDISLSDASVSVRDTGPGIPDAQKERLSQAFERGDQSRGFGLGLSIVSALCNRFGWTLELSNLPQGGTQATIWFAEVVSRE